MASCGAWIGGIGDDRSFCLCRVVSNRRPTQRRPHGIVGSGGGVGSMVSQIAANVVGCDVVGIAGGPEKCAFLLDHGCSATIDYKNENLAERLDVLRPDGIDLYFDNVGGETLAACLERLRMHSRVVLCGSISEYARTEPFA